MAHPAVVGLFRVHVESVHRLMRFDRDVLDFTMGVLGNLEHQLGDHGASRTVARTRKVLQGIRDHDSLRSRYQTICNQALVLLVSYFASAVADLFRQGVAAELERGNESPLLKEEIHISFRELVEADYDVEDIAPNLLIQTKDISFQDMKSISRAFQDHLGITIERTSSVNEIILAQACRHAIVHTGGVADDKLVRQISAARPRSLKPAIQSGERIQFTVEEVTQASDFMTEYLEQVAALLLAKDTTA